MHGNSKRLWVMVAAAAFVALAATVSAQAVDAQYVGAAKCKMCHTNEHKVWMESKHSKAFEALKPEEQKKPECVSCHTTGAGKGAAADADLKGVQCEACHGPGSAYKSMDIMNKAKYASDKEGQHKKSLEAGLIIPDEKTCTGCHNSKSPTFKGFEFASAKEKIKHWK